MCQRQLETWQQTGGEHVTAFPGEFDGASESIAGAAVDTHHIDVRIEDPLLRDPEPLVEAALDRFVPSSRGADWAGFLSPTGRCLTPPTTVGGDVGNNGPHGFGALRLVERSGGVA